jgi:hypothetical protein
MLMNNLDAEVAERPEELVVYGGIGRAARDWDAFDRIVAGLRSLETTRPCSSSRASRSASSAPWRMPRACSSPTPIWWGGGPPGTISTNSTARA